MTFDLRLRNSLFWTIMALIAVIVVLATWRAVTLSLSKVSQGPTTVAGTLVLNKSGEILEGDVRGAAQLVGKSFTALLPPEDRDRASAAFTKASGCPGGKLCTGNCRNIPIMIDALPATMRVARIDGDRYAAIITR